jgi:hypothetical protein
VVSYRVEKNGQTPFEVFAPEKKWQTPVWSACQKKIRANTPFGMSALYLE